MEVSIIILVVVAIAETVLNSRWVPFYFLNGITLFKKSVSFAEAPDLSPDDLTTQFSQGVGLQRYHAAATIHFLVERRHAQHVAAHRSVRAPIDRVQAALRHIHKERLGQHGR